MLLILFIFSLASVLCEYPADIPGPQNTDDAICVVGAGIAGVHMAVLLKEKGFTNVQVYEKEASAGGSDFHEEAYRGAYHQLGTSQFYSHGNKQIVEALYQKYAGSGILRNTLEPNVWLNETTSVTFDGLMLWYARMNYNASLDDNSLKAIIAGHLQRYIQLHQSLFGNYSGIIFDEPSWDVKFRIYGTMTEFLNRNNLGSVSYIFQYFFTVMGYGKLSKMAAVYGLMLCRPDTIKSIVDRLQGNGAITGFIFERNRVASNLVSNLIAFNTLNMTYNTEVYKMTRNNFGNVTIYLRGGVNGERTCDFVVWSTNLRTSLRRWTNPTPMEYQNFLRPAQRYAVKTLTDSINIRLTESPISFHFPADDDPEGDVTSIVDTWGLSNDFNGIAYKNRRFSTGLDNELTKTTQVFSQYYDRMPTVTEANNKVREVVTDLNGQSIDIRQTKIWSFFPHYYHQDLINDMLYTILKMQGKNKVWYTGPSVSFDSFAGVLEYNQLLVSKMASL